MYMYINMHTIPVCHCTRLCPPCYSHETGHKSEAEGYVYYIAGLFQGGGGELLALLTL